MAAFFNSANMISVIYVFSLHEDSMKMKNKTIPFTAANLGLGMEFAESALMRCGRKVHVAARMLVDAAMIDVIRAAGLASIYQPLRETRFATATWVRA
jgi:NAD(P)-dependent dehydrogenase (short-subunit alcohol dehydrogenase family)